MKPANEDVLVSRPVSKAVGNVKNNGPELLKLSRQMRRSGLGLLRRPGPSKGCSVAAIPGEMAYIENIAMGRAVASRAGNSFIPKLFPACSIWGEASVIAAGGGELAAASRGVAS